MDIFSHGLYGGVGFGRRSRKMYWLAFLIGMAPDLLSFGVFWLDNLLGIHSRPDWRAGSPDPQLIPEYVHTLYDITHSLVVFGVVCLLVWLIRKKPFLPLFAWGVHILVDIPSHSDAFFPTPFLWPISDFYINGISWGSPIIFIPNLVVLSIIYAKWYFVKKDQQVNKKTNQEDKEDK